MSYEVLILRRAQKELMDLPKTDMKRIRDAVEALAENRDPQGVKSWWGAKAGVFDQEIIEPFMK